MDANSLQPAVLTIAIPTYNRNNILRQNLEVLIPQLNRSCRLVIIDNCSHVPVAETLKPLIAEHPDADIKVIRNRINVGCNANILRCFETCETPWLWVLGDDDGVVANAVGLILRDIAAHPECIVFNYSYHNEQRKAAFISSGRNDYIDKIETYGVPLFISINVFKSAALMPNLRFGYQYAYSAAPHVAMLLMSLGEGEQCFFAKERLVDQNEVDYSNSYSFIDAALGQMTILELPLSYAARRVLAEKIVRKGLQSQEFFAAQLVFEAIKDKDNRHALYLYDQLFYRYYYFDRRWSRILRTKLYRLLIKFPKLGYELAVRWIVYSSGKGKAEGNSVVQNRLSLDRFNRL